MKSTIPTLDPTKLPKVMTLGETEWFILFAICVAGKSADQTKKKLNAFLQECQQIMRDRHILGGSPFYWVRQMAVERRLPKLLTKYRFGQYQRIEKAIVFAVSQLDVQNLTLADLESIPGVGPKTARFILLYTDPSFAGVPLDTHILKYLAWLGVPNVPKGTPPAGIKYALLESIFVDEAAKQHKSVRDLDTEVWTAYNAKDLTRLPGFKNSLLGDGREAA